MITESFHDFFLGVTGASGALVGLLFVAVSLAPEQLVGPQAPLMQQIRASTALTALVTPLVLSLIALIPGANVGWAASIVGAAGVLLVSATLRRLITSARDELHRLSIGVLVGFLIVMILELGAGIQLVVSPHATGPVSTLAGAIVASLTVGVNRSWELVGARTSGMTSSFRALLLGTRSQAQLPDADRLTES